MPPTFGDHKHKEKLVMKAGASTVIEIPFEASPMPEVSWKFKGGRMPDSRRFKEETIRGMTSLILSKVVASDAGEYTLNMENPFGRDLLTVRLVVLGRKGFGGFLTDLPPRFPIVLGELGMAQDKEQVSCYRLPNHSPHLNIYPDLLKY